LKQKMIRNMDQEIRNHLRLKASESRFDVKDTVLNMVVASMTSMVISNLNPETQTKLMDNIKSFNYDWFQSPLALSTWKLFYKVLKARREAIDVIKDVLTRRKESKEKHGDFVDTMLEDLEKENTIFDQGSAISLIFSILVVAKEGVPNITSIAVKFLSQNPKALAELKREHMAILRNRKDKGGVSWEEYRHSMSFTNMVISESLRLANLSPVMFRKALRDVEIKGYTIPAGWIVAVVPAMVHFDEATYENPLEFNPWRWEGKEMIWGSKTFMVFGGGVRLCVGAEFARLHIALFLHHLVTTYDFSLVQDCELIRTPFLHFTKGLLLNISESSK
ncbi:cytochrome P450 708A2, partial [Arabidopsis lyrata subsp. lyrata]